MPRLTVPGDSPIELHYEDTGGPGRPVVLIHGWPLSGRAWSAQVPALVEAGYRVITYDRRGFGQSDQPPEGYDYDTLAGDLRAVITDLDLHAAVLVGFSMGGGEVARYVGRFGDDDLAGVVFAAAITPCLHQKTDNPSGPMTDEAVTELQDGLKAGREGFFDGFMRTFFSAGDELKITEQQLEDTLPLCHESDQTAAVECIDAFSTTDFRNDISRIGVPTLVIHGDSDSIVPLEVSAELTHKAIEGSTLHVIEGGPHGINTSHADEFTQALLDFLGSL
jgi:non-heme chloroperoxidase